MNFKGSKGFTLIELLVVVAIISLLTSVVLASLRDAKNKANESKMIQTLQQVQNSLELYRANTGHYPYGYFEDYFVTEWGMTEKAYNEYLSEDPNYNELNKAPYIDLANTFQNLTLEDGTYIFYDSHKYTGEQWGVAITCDSDNSQTLDKLISNQSYSILIMYPPTYSLFKKLREGYAVDYGGVYPANGYWVSAPAACLSI